jgi:hypothetical protein
MRVTAGLFAAVGFLCVVRSAHGAMSSNASATPGPALVPPLNLGMVMETTTSSAIVFDPGVGAVVGGFSLGPVFVGDCAISPDGRLGFVSDESHGVWVIDLASSPPQLALGTNPVLISPRGFDLAVTPDGRFVVACGEYPPSPVVVVDVATRAVVSTLSLGSQCVALDVCRDGSVLVASSDTEQVRRLVIDATGHLTDSGESLSGVPVPTNVYCAADGHSGVVFTSSLNSVVSFRIPGMTYVTYRRLHGLGVSGAMAPDGTKFYARTTERALDAFAYDQSTATFSESPIFARLIGSVFSYYGIEQLAVDPDGTKVYVPDHGRLLVFDANTGATLPDLVAPGVNYPTGICFRSTSAPACATDGCDDGDPCTDDLCDPSQGCVYTPNFSPCDDGNACTTDDTCGGGTCHGGPALVCNDNNPCSTDTCNPPVGCVFTDNTNICDDGNACTANDTCGGGVCNPGGPTICDDENCCTIDSCNPAAGCVHTANTAPPAFTNQPSLGACPIFWPPNHGYVDVSVFDTGAAATSSCGIASIQFASCNSSQPENGNGTGDGNTMRDCVYEPGALHVRAERDGACSPIGRVYTTSLVAVDVCGNATTSNPMEVAVWHDRGNPPTSTNVVQANGSNSNDTAIGTNGTYGSGCGNGSTCANGSGHDHSDADPEMEITQQASISVDDLHLDKATDGSILLTWTEPANQAAVNVTRFHVYRLDPASLFWTQITEVTKQTTSYLDPSLNDGNNRHYKVTAVIK